MDGGPVSSYEDVGVRHKAVGEVGLGGAGSRGRSGTQRVHGMNRRSADHHSPMHVNVDREGKGKRGSKL